MHNPTNEKPITLFSHEETEKNSEKHSQPKDSLLAFSSFTALFAAIDKIDDLLKNFVKTVQAIAPYSYSGAIVATGLGFKLKDPAIIDLEKIKCQVMILENDTINLFQKKINPPISTLEKEFPEASMYFKRAKHTRKDKPISDYYKILIEKINITEDFQKLSFLINKLNSSNYDKFKAAINYASNTIKAKLHLIECFDYFKNSKIFPYLIAYVHQLNEIQLRNFLLDPNAKSNDAENLWITAAKSKITLAMKRFETIKQDCVAPENPIVAANKMEAEIAFENAFIDKKEMDPGLILELYLQGSQNCHSQVKK